MLNNCLEGSSYSSLAIILTIYRMNCILEYITHVSITINSLIHLGKQSIISFLEHVVLRTASPSQNGAFKHTKNDEQPKAEKNCNCIGKGGDL